MPKETKYAQVTEVEVELWLVNPVTIAFMDCLEWMKLDSVDEAGSGKLVDSSSADLTHALLHRAMGHQDAYVEALDPTKMLDRYVMIDHPPPPPDEDEDGE